MTLGARTPEQLKAIAALQDSLQGFRKDLDGLFATHRRHKASRARLRDLHARLLWSCKAKSSEDAPKVDTKQPAAPVGIAGVGKLSDESPSSKGGRVRQAELSLEKVGGREAVRSMVVKYFQSHQGSSFHHGSIQDIWLDEISGEAARLSVLLVTSFSSNCRQLKLGQDESGNWFVVQLMGGDASAENEDHDECEKSISKHPELPEAISRNPASAARSADVSGLDGLEEFEKPVGKHSELLEAISRNPGSAARLADLADVLGEEETVMLNQRAFGQKELFLEAIRLEPSFSRAYSDLGCVLSFKGGSVSIGNEQYDEKQLYIKAIELDPTLQLAYENLADLLEDGETVQVGNTAYSRRSLLAKATALDAARSIRRPPASARPTEPVAAGTEKYKAAAPKSLAEVVLQDQEERPCALSPGTASHISDLDMLDQSGDQLKLLGITLSPSGLIKSSLGSPTRSPSRSGAAKQGVKVTETTEAKQQKEQPRDLWASVGAVISGRAAEREDSDSSEDVHFGLYGKKSAAQLPQEKPPQEEQARDLWENVATEIRSGKLNEDYDPQRAAELETPASRLAAGSREDTPHQRLAAAVSGQQPVRDLWSNVASGMQSGALASDSDLHRAMAPGSEDNLHEKRLATVLEGPAASENRDLWSKVAAEITDGTLEDDFNLAKAKAMETPASRLAAETGSASPSKLLASVLTTSSEDTEWICQSCKNTGVDFLGQHCSCTHGKKAAAAKSGNSLKCSGADSFEVELLDDDDTDTDVDAARPRQASAAGLHLGERLRTPSAFMSSASQRARQATASAAARAAAPLVRGVDAAGGCAMAGAAPLGGLRLSGASAGSSFASDAVRAKASVSLGRRAPHQESEESSDDEFFSTRQNSSASSIGGIVPRATAAAAARRTKLTSVEAALNDSDDDDEDMMLNAQSWSSVSHRVAQEAKLDARPALTSPKGDVGPGVASSSSPPRLPRRLGAGDSDTSDSDGVETAALAKRWDMKNSPSAKAKARMGRTILDMDSD
eukprot:TRINITY_DN31813_c0_g1_i1.p1 TRINITY_DN31813_c0_g1~~TRINITY_DN31813_c0_g1_i1.p1  ORF type:complete len:1016 (-),score=252.82 TRINITY_DN31813_c0_g1_i1:8-3055(-)